jgi:polysaccharide biosynthesis transport protein
MEKSNTPQAAQLAFRELVTLLRRWWKFIAIAGLVGAALGGGLGYILAPRYTAKAQIVIEPRKDGAAEQGAAGAAKAEAAVETHVAMLTSDNHLQRVLDSFAGNGAGLRLHDSPSPADIGLLDIEKLRRNLKAFAERRSFVIGITFTSSSPTLAMIVANRTAELHLAAIKDLDRALRRDTLDSLGERIPLARVQVEQAEAAFKTYRVRNGFADPNRPDIIDQQLLELNRQLAVAAAELAARRARLAGSRFQSREDGTLSLQELDGERLPETTPGSVAITHSSSANLQQTRAPAGQIANEGLSQLKHETEIADARVSSLQQRLMTLQNASAEERQREIRLREVQREATAATQVYENLLQLQKKMLLDRDGVPELRLVSRALLPELPSSPHPVLFILPAMLAAMIGAGLLAVVRERLDDRLRSQRDVEETLEIPCIGIIPRVARRYRMSPHHHLLKWPLSPYAEAVRSVVATALDITSPGATPRVYLVTSSVRAEGKTALACSFAAYAAVLGRRVLLIDVDLRRSFVKSELPTAEAGGIAEILQGRQPADLIRAVPELGFDYLPACPSHDPVSLLADARFPELMGILRGSYDCILIDAPPLLGATEARLLASMADRVLFAVRWGTTPRQIAQNALNLIRYSGRGDGDLQGWVRAVLTRSDFKRHARYRFGDFSEALLLQPVR